MPQDLSLKDRTSYAERLLRVLTMFADGPNVLSIKELSERLSLPPSSVHRVLEPLVKLGFIERAPRRRYRMGLELFRIAAQVEQRFELLAIAKPLMAEITKECGEACLLAILNASRDGIVLAHKTEGQQPLPYKFDLLQSRSLVWGSLGRAILASLEATQVRTIIATGEPCPVSGQRLPERSVLQQELSEIRRSGIAVSHAHRGGRDAVGVSCAFFDVTGRVRGSLGVVAPMSRMPRDRLTEIGRIVDKRASALSRVLQGRVAVAKSSSRRV